MIIYTYSPWLVVLSVAIALMSSFTGLSLTRGLSVMPVHLRQIRIAMAAVALGGGIWSMHFVAMLAMRFNVPVSYELIETVASALIAILLAGTALLILHFVPRGPWTIALSGALLGIGIAVMHFVGLSATQGCLPQVSPLGAAVAGVLAVAMGIAAIAIAYGRRTERNILLATLVLGSAVVVVHFTAMAFTRYGTSPLADGLQGMAQTQMALLVLIVAFVISGAFLLSGASFFSLPPQQQSTAVAPTQPPATPPPPAPAPSPQPMPAPPDAAPDLPRRLPFERDGRTHFLSFDAVHALRADGHYTTVWTATEQVFCPWSITEAEARLPQGFVRVHRSWLINLSKVTAFERARDHGLCVMAGSHDLPPIPVARARVAAVREALGL